MLEKHGVETLAELPDEDVADLATSAESVWKKKEVVG